MVSRLLASHLIRSRLPSIARAASVAGGNLHAVRSLPPNTQILPLLRSLSTAVFRRQPTRSRPAVDIGARARQLQNRRLWTYALTFGCVAGFIVIVLANFQDQLVFYITPSDALQKFIASPSKSFRLGGLLLEGSVVHPNPSSPEIEFVVTDLITDILVRYEGNVPDLFREGHSVVVEGFMRPMTEEVIRSGPAVSEKARSVACFFNATEVLAKHDEKYMPKEVAAAIERNKKKIKAELEAAAAASETKIEAELQAAAAASKTSS